MPCNDGRLELLRQFIYTKMVIIVDDDVNEIKKMSWAISTRLMPQ